jgi:hypothetical protein
MKKAAAKKAKTKIGKPAKKKHSRKSKKPADIAEVRKEITELVTDAASELTVAVVEEGRKGQLAPVKYLFEMAGLYPAPGGAQEKPEEAALAKTLLDRLGLPHDPVIKEEGDAESKVNLHAGRTPNGCCGDGEESDDGRSQAENHNHADDNDVDAGNDVAVPAQINPVE